jgi:hypothetical protein
MSKKITTDLRGISEIFGIPLNSLRKKATAREFPIIKIGPRRILVSIEKFEEWLLEREVPARGETDCGQTQ